MKHKFKIILAHGKWAKGILYGKHFILHLQEGTVVNEHYRKWLIDRLNGKDVEPPEPPTYK